jgi:hypothetical protein
MPQPQSAHDATALAALVTRADAGDAAAKDALFAALDDELHRLAQLPVRRGDAGPARDRRLPTERLEIESAAAVFLRAMADHDETTGDTGAAIEQYSRLIDSVVASSPDVDNDIRNAYSLSLSYESLAKLHRQRGDTDRASAVDAKVKSLWEHTGTGSSRITRSCRPA